MGAERSVLCAVDPKLFSNSHLPFASCCSLQVCAMHSTSSLIWTEWSNRYAFGVDRHWTGRRWNHADPREVNDLTAIFVESLFAVLARFLYHRAVYVSSVLVLRHPQLPATATKAILLTRSPLVSRALTRCQRPSKCSWRRGTSCCSLCVLWA